MIDLRAAFGKKVKKLRSKRNLTQEELAYATNLDRTYVSDIERGVGNPSLLVICKIAEALNVPPSELLEIAQEE